MRNHIDIPGRREARWELLADLREIDPTVDLHYVGEGYWVLGSVRPNRLRYEQAGALLKEGHDRSTWMRRLWELALHGFSHIGTYRIYGDPDSRIVHDLRERDWLYRNDREATINRKLDEADGTAETERRINDTLAEAEARTRDSWGNFFAGRRSFDMGRTRA